MNSTTLQSSKQGDQSDGPVQQFAVAAETVTDPHHNYTILGRLCELRVDEYDSLEEAAREAARRAADAMPEQESELVDSEFHVFAIEDSTFVPVSDVSNNDE